MELKILKSWYLGHMQSSLEARVLKMWIHDLKHESKNQRRNYVDSLSHFRFHNSHQEKETGVSCPQSSFPPHSSFQHIAGKDGDLDTQSEGNNAELSQTQLSNLGLASSRTKKARAES